MSRPGEVYEGQWEAGDKHGKGKMTYASGELYEGQWKADNKHGQGKYTYADGGVYEGPYEADSMHGQGKYTYASGACARVTGRLTFITTTLVNMAARGSLRGPMVACTRVKELM